MFKTIRKCSVLLLLSCVTAFAAANTTPASYQRVIHSLSMESKGDLVLLTLTLQDGLTFYRTTLKPSEREIMETERGYAPGKNIYFTESGDGLLLFSENWDLIDGWCFPANFSDFLPKVVSIEFLKPAKNLPTWFSSPGFIMTLSDGSKWSAKEGTLPLWGQTQIGDSIFVSERYTDCGYSLINLDRGQVEASLHIQRIQ